VEERESHLPRVTSSSSDFVAQGRRNLQEGYRELIEREVQAKYAHQMTSTSRIRLFWLKWKIRAEVWTKLRRIGSDDSLYLCDFGKTTQAR
jgi:hypothetical protein